MPVPPTVIVDRSVRVPCTCGATTVWPYRAGGRGLTALPHPTDDNAVIQHLDDEPCGRIRHYPPDPDAAASTSPARGDDVPTLFDLDPQETR